MTAGPTSATSACPSTRAACRFSRCWPNRGWRCSLAATGWPGRTRSASPTSPMSISSKPPARYPNGVTSPPKCGPGTAPACPSSARSRRNSSTWPQDTASSCCRCPPQFSTPAPALPTATSATSRSIRCAWPGTPPGAAGSSRTSPPSPPTTRPSPAGPNRGASHLPGRRRPPRQAPGGRTRPGKRPVSPPRRCHTRPGCLSQKLATRRVAISGRYHRQPDRYWTLRPGRPHRESASSGKPFGFEPEPGCRDHTQSPTQSEGPVMTGSQTGKVAIVTGGSANLGKLFAESLASDGANVVVHYNGTRRAHEAQGVITDLKARGVEAIAYQGDLTSTAEIARLVDATIERFGHWDILVNTAGLIVRKPLAETTEEEYDNSFAINAKIPFFLMSQAYSKMADNGRIVNIVTAQVAVTAATYSAYAGSKAPVEHFTKAFAKEIGGRGITVNCIAPGPQRTSFLYGAENQTLAWLASMTISGALGDPVDVVPVMRFLAAPETRWVTAQTVYVNGGMISPIN